MITECILVPFIVLARFILDFLPDFDFDISPNALSGINILTKNLGYILPIKDLISVFGLWLLYISICSGFATVNRIKSFIPTMGG